MLYREVGQYETCCAADMAVFPILENRIRPIRVRL
jgi:hypothetical protein